MADQLSMIPGDVDALSLFDAPPPAAPAPRPAAPPPPRCPACHGRLDDVAPRCTCAIQPEGPASPGVLDLDDRRDLRPPGPWCTGFPDSMPCTHSPRSGQWGRCPACGHHANLHSGPGATASTPGTCHGDPDCPCPGWHPALHTARPDCRPWRWEDDCPTGDDLDDQDDDDPGPAVELSDDYLDDAALDAEERPCVGCGRGYRPSAPRSYGTTARDDTVVPEVPELVALYCWHCSGELRARWCPLPAGMDGEADNPHDWRSADTDAWNRYRLAHNIQSHGWAESGGVPWVAAPEWADPVDEMTSRLAPIFRRAIAAAAGPLYADHDRWVGQSIPGTECPCDLCHGGDPDDAPAPYIKDRGYAYGEPERLARELAERLVTADDRGQLF
jgi:hypothetical protein